MNAGGCEHRVVDGEHLAEARPRRLVRRPDGAWFGGVATGLAEYFGLPLVAVRLAFVALAVAGGTGVVLYGSAWVIVPEAETFRPVVRGKRAVVVGSNPPASRKYVAVPNTAPTSGL